MGVQFRSPPMGFAIHVPINDVVLQNKLVAMVSVVCPKCVGVTPRRCGCWSHCFKPACPLCALFVCWMFVL